MNDSPSRAARRRQYPSDVTDLQWKLLARLVVRPAAATGSPSKTNLRDVVSALNYRWTTGCAWRMLPHDFPPWGTVYGYCRHWERLGILPRIREILQTVRGRSGHVPAGSDPRRDPDASSANGAASAEWPAGKPSCDPRMGRGKLPGGAAARSLDAEFPR